jgi:TRAP-type C4-dicarboxylate transport system permease small subunit
VTRLSAAFGRLFDGLAVIAALILFGMVILVTADILLRNLFMRGFVWANEVSEYALYMMTLLTGPWLLRRGQHVRLDIVLSAVPRRSAWILEAVGDVFGLVVCLGIIYYGSKMTFEAWRLGSITIKNLVFPEWWLLAPMPAIFILIAIEFIFRFHRVLLVRDVRQEATSVA